MKRSNQARNILGLFHGFLSVRIIVGIIMVVSVIVVTLRWKRDGFAVYYLVVQTILTLLSVLSFLVGIPFLFFRSVRRFAGLAFFVAAN